MEAPELLLNGDEQGVVGRRVSHPDSSRRAPPAGKNDLVQELMPTKVDLPEFGVPEQMPASPTSTNPAGALGGARSRGLDVVVVYADREHSANLSYLSGFDPRFEEALFVVGRTRAGDPGGKRVLGFGRGSPLAMSRHLFQDFSLPSQPRQVAAAWRTSCLKKGLAPGRRVGVIGWKSFANPAVTDVPSYLVDELCGSSSGDHRERNRYAHRRRPTGSG